MIFKWIKWKVLFQNQEFAKQKVLAVECAVAKIFSTHEIFPFARMIMS